VLSISKYFQTQLQAWLNDVENDGAWRDAMVDQIRNICHVPTEEEATLIAEGTAQLDAFAKTKGRVRSLKLSTTVTARTKYDKKSGRCIGEMECDVHGATPEDIVAYLMHFDSKIRTSQLNRGVVRHETLEVKSLHHAVAFSEMKTIRESRSRTFLNALLWDQISDSPLNYTWVAVPIKSHPEVPQDDIHAVRSEVTRCCRLTQMTGGKTKVEYAFSTDWNGNSLELMRLPLDIRSYFLKVKPWSAFTAEDGAIFGHVLMDLMQTTKGPQRAFDVRMFVERTATLRECRFAHLDALFCGVFDESLLYELGLGLRKFKTVYVPEVVATNPVTMTAAGAASIGRGLESTLRTCANPGEAIDELLSKYPALGVMAHRHVWFRPLLETIAKRRMATAPLGLRLRLTIGALISIGDMASDINNIVSMSLAGNRLGAFVLLGLIALNIAFQGFVVILQTAHRGWRVVLWELSILISLLKPGIDAIRVAGGEERIEGAPLDPLMEMVFCKLSELTFESIPGGLAQAIFILNGGEWTTGGVISVGLSCLSTAFTATMLTYDLDTNTTSRTLHPEFYGYMPDTSAGRFLAFALFFLYHSAWALGKTFSMAVLAQTNWMWLVVYLLADHGGLILYKLASGDLIYWPPGFGVPISVLCRFAVKVIVDFTGCAGHCALSPFAFPHPHVTDPHVLV
jgi:hypothetical protein